MVNFAQQQAFAFQGDETYAYHDTERGGFFSLLTKAPEAKKAKQTSHAMKHLPAVLARIERSHDTWISQNEFYRPNRRIVSLWRLTACFVDLDTYNVERLGKLPISSQVSQLLRYCDEAGIPEPSLIVFSGRGLQAKWILSSPVPARALPRWQATQNELCRRLDSFGADVNARDASRVLRVVDTVNSKSQTVACVVHWARTPTNGASLLDNGAMGYDFEILSASVLPLLREVLIERDAERELQRQKWKLEKTQRDANHLGLTVLSGGKDRKKPAYPNLNQFVRSQLAWDRIGDIRKLAELRGYANGFPAKKRNLPLFLCACFLADAQLAQDIESELVELAQEFAPTWSIAAVRDCASGAYERACASFRGEKVEFEGREVDPRYRWTNSTLIQRLGITAEEERAMVTIISKGEKRQRSVDRSAKARLHAGCQLRAQWLEAAEQRRVGARLLRVQGLSYPRIAAELGISVASAHAYCKV